MQMTYDSNPVPVTYGQEELEKVIDEYLNGETTEFSFKRLCHHIVEKAIFEGKVRNANNTHYSSRELNPFYSIEVSKCLWKLIWDRKVFIVFGDNPYMAHYNNDTHFVVNK